MLAEVAARRERHLSTRTKMAHLAFLRTLEQFDFAVHRSIDERQLIPVLGDSVPRRAVAGKRWRRKQIIKRRPQSTASNQYLAKPESTEGMSVPVS